MTEYAWIFDKDHSEGGKMVNWGVSNSEDLHRRLLEGEGLHFRLYDDDGKLYYEGRLVSANADTMAGNLGEEGFAPLDDFGEPDAGCTRIDYLHPTTGKWEIL